MALSKAHRIITVINAAMTLFMSGKVFGLATVPVRVGETLFPDVQITDTRHEKGTATPERSMTPGGRFFAASWKCPCRGSRASDRSGDDCVGHSSGMGAT
jgi:hypothetical protein